MGQSKFTDVLENKVAMLIGDFLPIISLFYADILQCGSAPPGMCANVAA